MTERWGHIFDTEGRLLMVCPEDEMIQWLQIRPDQVGRTEYADTDVVGSWGGPYYADADAPQSA